MDFTWILYCLDNTTCTICFCQLNNMCSALIWLFPSQQFSKLGTLIKRHFIGLDVRNIPHLQHCQALPHCCASVRVAFVLLIYAILFRIHEGVLLISDFLRFEVVRPSWHYWNGIFIRAVRGMSHLDFIAKFLPDICGSSAFLA